MIQMTGVLIERGDLDMDTQRQNYHMTMEAEMGVMALQAKNSKNCSKPPEFKESQGRILPCRFQRVCGPQDTLISDI